MTKIPSPRECGLPEKFPSWRANQEAALDVMTASEKRFISIAAPTGFGKSLTYMAYALKSGKRTCIVTNSRGLQDQLLNDFEEVGLVDIRGRNNYPCEMREDYSCEEGYVARCPYKGSMGCPASAAEFRAAASPLVVTNYAKWTSSQGHGRGMENFEQVIFDEGHDAPGAVDSAMEIELGSREIEDELKLSFPRHNQHLFDTWKRWACGTKHEVENEYNSLKQAVADISLPKAYALKRVNHLRNLVRRLSILMTANPDNWVVEEVEKGYRFDPIRSSVYAEGILFLHIPRIIIVSATLRPKTLFLLGVSKELYQFNEFPSDFDRSRCPIYYVPTMRVDSKASDLGMLWVRVDQILAKRRDRKGIIHTISYARRDDVLNNSRFASSMLINQKGEAASGIVEIFRQSVPGTILVSPSVSTGYDFPGQQCEYQIMCKIPFPDGRSPIMKARQQMDKEYGPYLAIQTMIQAFGRGMRSKNDLCENFIPDDHMQWFLPRYSHLAPRTFHSFYRTISTLPQPPEKFT